MSLQEWDRIIHERDKHLYHMIYPRDAWVPGEDLILAANDSLEIDTITDISEAIQVLHDLGQVTITQEEA